MRYFAIIALLASAAESTLGATTYLVGDSTMASLRSSSEIQGWGAFISSCMPGMTIINKGRGGSSLRSYTHDGKWAQVETLLQAGDFVVIQLSHNEAGTLRTSLRASTPGEGPETTTVTLSNGIVETVLTWHAYMNLMIAGAWEKGALPIVASITPINPFESERNDKIDFTPGYYVKAAKRVAEENQVPYVDHFTAVLLAYQKVGKNVTNSYYPKDHTHTNPAGAAVVAQAFVSAVSSSNIKNFDKYINFTFENPPPC